MNTKHKGGLAMGAAIWYFTGNNIPVLLPINDSEKYDLVIENGSLKKVQCKYTNDTEPSGSYIVDLRTFGGYRNKTYFSKYIVGDFDLLFVYCGNGEKYLIPADKIINKSQIVVGKNSWREFMC